MKNFRKIITFTICCFLFGTYSVSSMAAVSSESVIGVWEGEYQGQDQNDNKVTRKILLNIDDCNKDGKIDGTATIDEGEMGKYSIKGSVDFDNDVIAFTGDKWILRPKSLGFSDFDGTFNADATEIFGTINNDQFSTFSMKKVSDFQEPSPDLTNIPSSWNGEYDGKHGSDGIVRRNFSFAIDEIKADGGISGIAIFSPSEKSDEKYAANGSYHFTGTIDTENSTIFLMGDEWLDQPIDKDNLTWEFVGLKGIINGNEIKGFSEDGIWRMKAFDENQYKNIRNDFILGIDNNSYYNSNSSVKNSGFDGQTYYEMNEEYAHLLEEISSDKSGDEIIEKLTSGKYNWFFRIC